MSKYVRTKDNQFIELCSRQEYEKAHPEFINNDTFNYDKWFNLVTQDIDILKQADTIEELCDKFVEVHKILQNGIFDKPYFDVVKEEVANGSPVGNLYGAIWTDKGLIYVAKMNKDGVLELI